MALYMPPFWQALLYEDKYNMYIYISEYENEQMYSTSSGCGYLPDRWIGMGLHCTCLFTLSQSPGYETHPAIFDTFCIWWKMNYFPNLM